MVDAVPQLCPTSTWCFVENRLRHLVATGRVNVRVVAPVPWFPSSARIFARYGLLATVVPREQRAGIAVEHPRYLAIPKIGMNWAPTSLAASGLPVLRRLQQDHDFDLAVPPFFRKELQPA